MMKKDKKIKKPDTERKTSRQTAGGEETCRCKEVAGKAETKKPIELVKTMLGDISFWKRSGGAFWKKSGVKESEKS